MKLEAGSVATPYLPQAATDVARRQQRYYQTETVRSENGPRHIPLQPMRATPAVTVGIGTAGSITPHGFELTHTAAADCSVVADAAL